ncbi:hypothetical protein L9F63_026350 [Diploptera punctata]|uniref:NADH dehydrogenase [ubiquinone] 1 beta subcomplex subunit 11, mitochondrial n=1 Tax=Diploptera punctata TaxID=6984 RepID=A0AAD8ERK8_DIPPU|nr:hypothetical protein L9F63_026350 [Diploptera punctata]
MAAIVRIMQNFALRRSLTLTKSNIRAISTSKKNRDTVCADESIQKKQVVDFTSPKTQNWVSYGFDHKNEKDDLNAMHSTFFFSITLCIVFGGLIFTYYPDVMLRDWSQREGYLELRRREELGLPLIDRNLIDPEKNSLPSDEELGETEIII